MWDMWVIQEVLWELEKLGVNDAQIRDYCGIKDANTLPRWWAGSEPRSKNRFKLNRLLEESRANAIETEAVRKSRPHISQSSIYSTWKTACPIDLIQAFYHMKEHWLEMERLVDEHDELVRRQMLYPSWKSDSWIWNEFDFLVQVLAKFHPHADVRRQYSQFTK